MPHPESVFIRVHPWLKQFDRMALPLTYNFRNVLVRWRATAATILGVALVVTVYILMQAMAAGLVKSSQNTGDPRNVMIVRKGSTA